MGCKGDRGCERARACVGLGEIVYVRYIGQYSRYFRRVDFGVQSKR